MITIKDGIKIVTGRAFRMVYMGTTHIITIEGTEKTKTWTKYDIEEFTTEKQVEARIKELELTEIDLDSGCLDERP